MADDRLLWCRSESMMVTRSPKVASRPPAISFNAFQNASSRLTLVLRPAMTIERLTTGDFMARPPRPRANRGALGDLTATTELGSQNNSKLGRKAPSDQIIRAT